MAVVFDGRSYSLKKKTLLTSDVKLLKEKGKYPKMATILVGNDTASILYVNLKKKYIEEIGAELDIYRLPENVEKSEVLSLIKSLNEDKTVNGIMIQLPFPAKITNYKLQIINSIALTKDVDGMREDSKFIPPTVKAILEILKLALFETKKLVKEIDVVGASGMVGKPLVKKLQKMRYVVNQYDKTTPFKGVTFKGQVLISAVGVANLISDDMVKNDAILIDVGSPFGDIDPRCENKASFITPVPGGVGPVTISCLAENLVASC